MVVTRTVSAVLIALKKFINTTLSNAQYLFEITILLHLLEPTRPPSEYRRRIVV
ncbi:hypothetical protein TOL_0884 [Thalassolituus oleivorans MIL-1]|uniref:Uncharacterized protein n=1 Tax=Thalassolituus oleivorans MIL-1 TaxID=1298593 RepID=M5DN08_9GAMM|nr:hypothetical protein TOL_0884 [Thalassolituus oleivorans MIL-1]